MIDLNDDETVALMTVLFTLEHIGSIKESRILIDLQNGNIDFFDIFGMTETGIEPSEDYSEDRKRNIIGIINVIIKNPDFKFAEYLPPHVKHNDKFIHDYFRILNKCAPNKL